MAEILPIRRKTLSNQLINFTDESIDVRTAKGRTIVQCINVDSHYIGIKEIELQ